MEMFVKLASVLVLLTQVQSQEIVEVQSDSSAAAVDLSKTDLTTSYCILKDNECPGANIAPGQFAATTAQCLALCTRNLQCLSAFYTYQKTCYLRGGRCDMSQLKSNTLGIDLYRLKKKETCPANRPLFTESAVSYSNKFCLMRGKACPGHDMYPKPQNIASSIDCLKKCAKINTCPGIDFYSTVPKCEPKDYACSDAELVDSPGTLNYIRLEEGVSQCPGNRVAGESVADTASAPDPAPASVPAPEPQPEKVPDPQPEPAKVPDPEPEPAKVPAPEPEPEQKAPVPEPEPAPAPEKSQGPAPATCSFYAELQQLMAKYPDGCGSCP